MKLKLRDITDSPDKNRWCGPSVISAVTKLTTGEAARLIRELTGKRKVTGTAHWHMRLALKACNIQMIRKLNTQAPDGSYVSRHGSIAGTDEAIGAGVMGNDPSSSITLSRWLRNTVKIRNAHRVFLLVGANHWQLVSGRRYICGLTRKIVSVKHARFRRGRINAVYELLSDNVQIPEIIKQYRRTL